MRRAFLILTFLAAVFAAISMKQNKRSKSLSDQITVICTTNPIPSIPSTKILEQTMRSLDQNAALRSCKKIIVFDGIQPGYEGRREDYEKYKENVANLCLSSPYFQNTELIFCTNWVHLAGAIDTALQSVTTRYSRKLWMKEKEERILKKFF